MSPETKLSSQSTRSYESFSASSLLTGGSSSGPIISDFNENYAVADLNGYSKDVPSEQLGSTGPSVTDKDGASQNRLISVYSAAIIFAFAVTIALILHIYLGASMVPDDGVLVSDHERCTGLGRGVLRDGGSSVDAAVAAVLCLGVVHPHASGVGGGGVMMVHDIRRNQTKVLNFLGTAPKALTEEMLHGVSELKEGLQVGVPAMLRGLHRAHRLYGRLKWEDVVARAAAVAREGFSVSSSLAEAISKVKGQRLSPHFRDLFLPGGRALRSGSLHRMPALAGVLEAGVSGFYNGNVSQEIVDEVQSNGGVLTREDLSDYTVEVDQPLEGLFNDFIIQVPPSSTGAALISAISLLHLIGNNTTTNITHQWILEATGAALAESNGLEEPKYNSSVTKQLSDILSKSPAAAPPTRHSSPVNRSQSVLLGGQVIVMGPDDLMVSVASSLSGPFGSRLVTRSGVLLNSLILDFSWPNRASGLRINQSHRIESGKGPLSPLMPTIVLPAWNKCGLYMALSSSGRAGSFTVITQLLIDAQNETNCVFSGTRLHPQADACLVVQSAQDLHEKTQTSEKSDVRGILRNKDFIKPLDIPVIR
ncbi:glutathione hydrolase 7-like [Betta splendens]|uniref:Glutathione hydrolase n=1 Tax=Betta splendens TaxID=158456 RepID=A0A6P7MLD2_BETSP|nr:glutathione hydrolase 7-like [Betta splendens]